jgi:hypothetical protein
MREFRHRFACLALPGMAVASFLLLTACHGDSGLSAKGTPTADASAAALSDLLRAGDLCRYFTQADASAALGGLAHAVPQPAPINTAGTIFQTCAYSNSAGEATVLFRKSSPAQARAAFDGARGGTAAAVDIEGLGEAAFYSPAQGQLVVKQKDVYFVATLGTTAPYPAAPSDALKTLASSVAQRI